MNETVSSKAKSLVSDEDLGRQIAALREDLAKIAHTAGNDIGTGVSEAGRRIEQGARDARASATGAVLDHPLAAVAIAAGVGFLVGVVTRRS
jgi:ElaB/YqjD/DUF883 family membrane-anchored ribosome-binding protein